MFSISGFGYLPYSDLLTVVQTNFVCGCAPEPSPTPLFGDAPEPSPTPLFGDAPEPSLPPLFDGAITINWQTC